MTKLLHVGHVLITRTSALFTLAEYFLRTLYYPFYRTLQLHWYSGDVFNTQSEEDKNLREEALTQGLVWSSEEEEVQTTQHMEGGSCYKIVSAQPFSFESLLVCVI